jgi:hypothetical protein
MRWTVSVCRADVYYEGVRTLTGQWIERWITTEEAAEHLCKPPSWLHANADRLGVPRRRLGNQYRYRLSELDAWLDGQA